MNARPTIGDVAEAAGVSVATVSRALRGLDNVSDATKRKVESAATKLDYTVDSRASSLASGRTRTIGLVAPYFESWYASQIVSTLSRGLARAGYDLLVYSMEPDAANRVEELRTRFRGRRIDAAVFIDMWFDEHERALLPKIRVPIVTIGDRTDFADSISVNDIKGGRLVAEHLLELGHTSFGFVGGARPGETLSPPARDREAAVREMIAAAGLPQSSMKSVDGSFSVDGGQLAFSQFLEDGELPTAIICASDEMAIGVIAECLRLGYSIPEDVSVTGFDGHDMAPLFGLTTVDQHVREKGQAAVDLVIARLDENVTDVEQREATVELVVRTSTGPASR